MNYPELEAADLDDGSFSRWRQDEFELDVEGFLYTVTVGGNKIRSRVTPENIVGFVAFTAAVQQYKFAKEGSWVPQNDGYRVF